MEILLVLALLVLVFTAVVRPLASFRDIQALNSASIQIVSLLNDARIAAIASKESSVYGVHFESGRAVYFKGISFIEPSSYNKEIKLDGSIFISLITLEGGAVDAVFEQLTGETSSYGTVTLSAKSDSSLEKVITISQTGITTHN